MRKKKILIGGMSNRPTKRSKSKSLNGPKKFTGTWNTRFTKFVRELGKLSTKHGIAIQSTGGIFDMEEFTVVTYDEDYTSGDLSPRWD